MTVIDFCLGSAGLFFLAGLGAGVWKYACVATSVGARAPAYVDVTHRASLLYAFACALLAELGGRSAWSNAANLGAAIVLVSFFTVTIAGYAIHGALRDTDNQLARPHRLGRRTIPAAAMVTFMVLLAVSEIGAFLVLFTGYLAGTR